MSNRFDQDRCALVVGAGSGIGLDCAERLLENGWVVVGMDVQPGRLQEKTFKRWVDDGRLKVVQADVASEAAVDRAMRYVESHVPRLSALVYSAGIMRNGRLMDMEVKEFDELFSVNVRGAWLVAKGAFKLLKGGSADGRAARIIFINSIAAIRPKVGGGAYAASKAALAQITRVLAVEAAEHRILINGIAPSTVDTPMLNVARKGAEGSGYRPSGPSPLGRIASPADITNVITFLLSDSADYISGVILPVDGSTTAAYDPSHADRSRHTQDG